MVIEIKPPFIKLDSLLKLSGIANTGGHAKIMISDGEVTVNGEICLARGKKIFEGDVIKTCGEIIEVKFGGSYA